MRRAIEKLSFSVLSLVVASLVSFAMLARVTDGLRPRRDDLPLLFNPAPRNARELALRAMRAVAAGGPEAPGAARELVRLGGAGLPHVLPTLDTLEPGARGRVALALGPVARRMGVADDDELSSPERAIAFFTRFWQDRSADFRPAVVRRKVARLAERALPLRRKEVTELDTFALPALLEALGSVRTAEDARRVARLAPVLAHVTGVRVDLAAEPDVTQAREAVSRFQSFALEHALDFTTLDGPQRLTATVTETRYFRWVASVARALGKDDPAGMARALGALRMATSTLLYAGLSVGLAFLASLGAERLLSRHGSTAKVLGAVALGAATLPPASLSVRLLAHGYGIAVGGLTLALAALFTVELQAFAAPGPWLRRALARLALRLPVAVTALVAGEAVLGVGLGGMARRAVAAGDLSLLMWVGFPIAATGALSVAIGDLLRPAPTRVATELDPAERRRPLLIGAGVVLAGLSLVGLLGRTTGDPRGLSAALGTTVLGLGAATGVAVVVGGALGLLAGGVSRTAHGLLVRARELLGALPEPLVACAALSFGGPLGAIGLGLLRAFDVAEVLSQRLNEQRVEEALEPPSGGGAPLSPYLRRVLPHAARATAVSVALSIPWLSSVWIAGAAIADPLRPGAWSLAAPALCSSQFSWAAFTLLGAAALVLASELSPRSGAVEADSTVVVLALKRRVSSPDDLRVPGGDD